MDTIFLLISIRETDERPDFQIRAFEHYDNAHTAYNKKVEDLKNESAAFETPREIISSSNRCQKYEVFDMRNAIDLTAELKEVPIEGVGRGTSSENVCCLTCAHSYRILKEPCASCYMHSKWKQRC